MRVLFLPDLSKAMGSGHAMRDLAVAEALVAAGDEVVYACHTAGLEWVERAIVDRGCRIVLPDGTAGAVTQQVEADAVLIDSYSLPTSQYDEVRALGVPLVAIVDGARRGARADLLVDPGPVTAADWQTELQAGQRVLYGVDYALVRREFRTRTASQRRESGPLRVLVTFGGTDARGAAPAVAQALLALGHPVDLTVVARDDLRNEIGRLALFAGQRLAVVSPGAGFPELVRAHDLVVSAAGSTTWELLALGVATGLVCVADNQERYYQALPEAGAAVAVGTLAEVSNGAASVTHALRALVGDSQVRKNLRGVARQVVDGRGGERVAAELRRLVDAASSGRS